MRVIVILPGIHQHADTTPYTCVIDIQVMHIILCTRYIILCTSYVLFVLVILPAKHQHAAAADRPPYTCAIGIYVIYTWEDILYTYYSYATYLVNTSTRTDPPIRV